MVAIASNVNRAEKLRKFLGNDQLVKHFVEISSNMDQLLMLMVAAYEFLVTMKESISLRSLGCGFKWVNE